MRRVLVLAAVLVGVLALPGAASALPAGSFDPTFGGTGFLTPDVLPGVDDDPFAAAVDSQNRTVAIYGCGCTGDVNLVRFKADGSLDPMFGTGGVREVADHTVAVYSAGGVAIQSDGRIVVSYWDASGEWLVTRFNADGTPDSSFASGAGTFVQNTGVGQLKAMTLDGDRIVLAGADNSSPTKPAVLRLTANGDADSSFNGGAVQAIDFGGTGDGALAVQAAPNHKLAVVGITDDGIRADAAVARLKEDGTADTAFSSDGMTTVDFGDDWLGANGTAAAADGSIVFAGAVEDQTTHRPVVTVTKLKPDGDPDPAFSGDGQQTTAFPGSFSANDLTLSFVAQADGAFLVGGYDGSSVPLPDGFLYRYTPAGELDTVFSGDGRQAVSTGRFQDWEQVSSLALAPDGRVVALGPVEDLQASTIKTMIARILTAADNCPAVVNPDQADLDGDGSGDPCDDDIDGDGLTNAVETAIGSNPRGTDSDGDGKSDGADACPTLSGTLDSGCPAPVVPSTDPPKTDPPKTDPPVVLDRTAPQITVSGLAAKIARAAFLAKGVTVTIGTDESSTLVVELIGTLKGVHLARVADVVIAAKTLPAGSGRRTVTLKLGRAQKKLMAKSAKLTLRVSAFDKSGNLAVTNKTFKVK